MELARHSSCHGGTQSNYEQVGKSEARSFRNERVYVSICDEPFTQITLFGKYGIDISELHTLRTRSSIILASSPKTAANKSEKVERFYVLLI